MRQSVVCEVDKTRPWNHRKLSKHPRTLQVMRRDRVIHSLLLAPRRTANSNTGIGLHSDYLDYTRIMKKAKVLSFPAPASAPLLIDGHMINCDILPWEKASLSRCKCYHRK